MAGIKQDEAVKKDFDKLYKCVARIKQKYT
jgi:hypothetical protein